MSDDCRELGFEMDCGRAFYERYGVTADNANELLEVIDKTDDIQLLDSAIYKMHDPIFLAGKSEAITREDLQVTQDLLDLNSMLI